MHNRRQYLRTVATVAGSAALAGCSSDALDVDSGTDDSGATEGPATGDPESLGGRAPGWVGLFGSGMRLQHNPVDGPASAPSETWSTEVGGDFVSVRGRGDTLLVVNRREPSLAAHDAADGTERWQTTFDVDGGIFQSTADIAIAGETVAVASQTQPPGGVVVGYDLASGERLWREETRADLLTDGATLYPLVEREGGGLAVERRDPSWERLDRTPLPEGDVPGSRAVAGDRLVYLQTGDTTEAVAVVVGDGGEQWRTELPGEPSPQVDQPPLLATTGRTAFAAVDSGGFDGPFGSNLVALDLADGSELWRRFDGPDETATTAEGERVALVRGAPGYCYLGIAGGGNEIRDERTGELTDTMEAGVTLSDAMGSYWIEGTEEGRSLVARPLGGDGERWRATIPQNVRIVATVGGRLVGIRRSDEGRSVVVFA